MTPYVEVAREGAVSRCESQHPELLGQPVTARWTWAPPGWSCQVSGLAGSYHVP